MAADDGTTGQDGDTVVAAGARRVAGPTRAAHGAWAARRGRGSGGWGLVKEALIVMLVALVITSLTRAFVMQPFVIPSGSMLNTLQGGPGFVDDRVMAVKFGGFDRGDVVVFEDYAHWLTSTPTPPPLWKQALETVGLLPDSSKNYLVKRAIGLPGDRVACCTPAGRVSVNGVELDESEYLYTDPSGTAVKPSDFPFEVVVPAGRIFVMGDHRNASADSRCHLQAMGEDAFVPVDRVAGPVKFIILPQNRWRTFDPPAAFARIPAPTDPPPAAPLIKADQVRC